MGDVKYIEFLADQFEVPIEQMMIAVAVIEKSEPYWDSYYLGSESVIEGVLSKVFCK